MEGNLFNCQIKNPRILITGGAGFIGSALIRNLLINTSCYIFNLDKISYASDLTSIEETLKKLGQKNSSRYKLLKVNLLNSNDTYSAIKFANPDYVLHLAAESHVDRSIEGPKVFIESNILGTFNLLESVRKYYSNCDPRKKEYFRFLHISTDEVFGSLGFKGYFNELSSYDPRSPYSASKAASDHIVNAWHHTFDLPILVTNCSNNYGPWQHAEKLIPKIIINALNKCKIPIYGNGENIRDWLYVDDHISGILKVLNEGEIGEKYCIGGNQEKTNNEVVNSILAILDREVPQNYSYKELITYVNDRLGHDKRYAIDSSKIRSQLNWKPKYSLKKGLICTVKWYVENFRRKI